jgi:hypothetical protein
MNLVWRTSTLNNDRWFGSSASDLYQFSLCRIDRHDGAFWVNVYPNHRTGDKRYASHDFVRLEGITALDEAKAAATVLLSLKERT